MRILREDIHDTILYTARREFLSKGFKDASMRNIAKKANVGLSNIYNYFNSKDEIFCALIIPAKKKIMKFILDQHTDANIDFDLMSTTLYQEKSIEEYIKIVDRYREELLLLLYLSEGSSMRNFRETLIDYLTKVSNKHMDIIKQHYPQAKAVSTFFIRSLCAYMISIIGEIILNNLSKQKMRDFFREYLKFETAGWRALIGI